jgi:CBS domain-containing protein
MANTVARDIMTADPATTSKDVTVTQAARLMTDKNVGSLPVLDGGKLVGIVTEGDLIMQDVKLEFPTYIHLLDGFIMYPPSTARFEKELRKAVAATVADVMTKDPVTVQVDTSIEDVATLLSERDVSRLPVLDGDRLVGIVSKHDIVRSLAGG